MIRMRMKNGRRVVLTACLGVTTAAGLALTGQPAEAATLCVGTGPGCYTTIQAAVNAAHDGDRIAIGPGAYAGGITVDVSVQLVGAGPATRISGGGPVVTIGSATATPTVTIANLTITGGVTTTDPQSPKCGPDVPACGPGYPSATALGGGVEAFPGTTVTILHSVVTGNRAVPGVVRGRGGDRRLGHDDADRHGRQRQPRVGGSVQRRWHRRRGRRLAVAD